MNHEFMKKVIILLVIVIMLGGAFFWLFATLPDIDDSVNENQNIKSEIDDWQTYQNNEIGFVIHYPIDWVAIDTNANQWDVIGFREKDLKPGNPSFSRIYIQLKDNPSNYSLREYYKKQSESSDMTIPDYFEIDTPKQLVIDGIEAVQFPIIPGPISNTKTSIPLEQAILEIDKHNDFESADRIYDLMIQSLRFED